MKKVELGSHYWWSVVEQNEEGSEVTPVCSIHAGTQNLAPCTHLLYLTAGLLPLPFRPLCPVGKEDGGGTQESSH